MIPVVSRSTTLALVAASLLGTTTALADDAPPTPASGEQPRPVPSQEAPHTYRLLAEPVVTVPLGAFAQVTGPGVGALLGGDYRLSDAWRLTARAGYVQGSETSIPVAGLSLKSSVSYAPVLAGARVVVVGGDVARLYAAAEGGALYAVSSASVAVSGVNASASGDSLHVCAGGSVGLELDVLDLRVGLLAGDLAHADSSTVATVSLGFRFASF